MHTKYGGRNMATNKRVFTLHLEGGVFDKIALKAKESHRSMTNYIEFVLLKHLEDAEQGQNQVKMESGAIR